MRARRLIAESFGRSVDSSELDRAKLIVTELVTNALLHGHGGSPSVQPLMKDRLLVELIDEGFGFERMMRQHDVGQLGGWGSASLMLKPVNGCVRGHDAPWLPA